MWPYLALFITSCIFMLLIAIIWHIKNLVTSRELYSVIPYKRMLASKDFNKINTGDIIYTRNSINPCQEYMIPYIYKHAGIIIEFNNNLYVAETAGRGIQGRKGFKLIRRKNGVGLCLLKDKLKNSVGAIFISKLNKPLDTKRIELLQDTFIIHKNDSYPMIIYLFILFVLHIPIKTNMFCYSFVYQCLLNADLIKEPKTSAREIGKFITEIYNYDLQDGYNYEIPKQLIYDFDCEEELF